MRRIWTALLIANVAWSLHLVVSYYLAWVACSGDDGRLTTLRHLATVVALGVTMAALWWGCRIPPMMATDNGQRREQVAEHAFLTHVTLLLSAMLLFAIVLAGAANVILVPCM